MHAQQQVRERPDRAPLTADAHAREHRFDLRAERLERRLEQQVLLEAVAAAAGVDELARERVWLQRHGDPDQRIEVLEEDPRHMRAVEFGQGGTSHSCKTDPPQVSGQVEHFDGELRDSDT